jgi:hypothetical protein
MEQVAKHPGGRPKWIPTPKDILKAEELAARGLTKEQIAHYLCISYDTLNERTKEIAEFSDAIKRGQAFGIEKIANSLFETALSGNVTAQIFYLKSRAGWKETEIQEIKQETSTQNTVTLELVDARIEEMSKRAK